MLEWGDCQEQWQRISDKSYANGLVEKEKGQQMHNCYIFWLYFSERERELGAGDEGERDISKEIGRERER